MEDKSWKKWKMPEVKTGDAILYYKNLDPNTIGIQAFAGKIYDRVIDATIVMNGSTQPRISLHHKDDPGLLQHADHWIEAGGGVFEFADSTKRQHEIIERLDLLEERLAEMDGATSPKQKPATDTPAKPAADTPAKRRPGRPRKPLGPTVDKEPELANA